MNLSTPRSLNSCSNRTLPTAWRWLLLVVLLVLAMSGPARADCVPNAWQIADSSTQSGSILNYTFNLTPEQKVAATNNGWRFSMVSRMTVVAFDTDPAHFMIYGTGERRFVVALGADSEFSSLSARLFAPTNLEYPLGVNWNDYHTHELSYDPATRQATYVMDGRHIATWSGDTVPAQVGTPLWGSASDIGSATMNYHRVTFSINGLGTVAEYNAGLEGHPSTAPSPINQGWTRNAGSVSSPEAPVSPDSGQSISPVVSPEVAAYRQAVLNEPSLVGYYPVDCDTAPTVTDRIAPAANGTLMGTSIVGEGPGVMGTHALEGSYVALDVVPEYQFADGVGTIEAVLYMSGGANSAPCLFSCREKAADTTRYEIHVVTSADSLFLYNGTNTTGFGPMGSLLNQRVHVAFVFSNGMATAYLNGISMGTKAFPLGALGQPCQIGASTSVGFDAWHGLIDELAIYTNALSARSIGDHVKVLKDAGPIIEAIQQGSGTGAELRFREEQSRQRTYLVQSASTLDGGPFGIENEALISDVDGLHFLARLPANSQASKFYRIAAFDGPPQFGVAITTQPRSVLAEAGTQVLLSVRVVGSDVHYQWRRNGVDIQGATGATLTIPSVQSGDLGEYTVRIWNDFGAVTTEPAQLLSPSHAAPGEGGLNLVPWPKSLGLRAGTLNLSPISRVVADAAALVPLARVLSNELYQVHGVALATTQGGAQDGDIELRLDSGLQGEQHLVDVGNRALVSGSNYAAVAAGTVTFLQASRITNGNVTLPRFLALDSPDVAIRSLFVDVVRRYHSPESLRQLVDLCRQYKLNYLHLYLTGDEAFMFPLTNTLFAPVMSFTTSRGRPPYSRSDLIALESYARDRGVFIMPELEVPGHCSLLVQAQPSLYEIDTDTNLLVGVNDGTNGYRPSGAINIADPACVNAVSNMLVEMCQVFTNSPYIHVGCDEVDLTPWSHLNPEFKDAFRREGIPYSEDGLASRRLLGGFIGKLRNVALSQGKKTMCWEHIALRETPPEALPRDVLVMPFDSQAPNSFVAEGFQLVNAAWRPLYVVNFVRTVKFPTLNRANPSLPQIYGWDRTQFGILTCSDPDPHYNVVDPSHVVGAQLNAWEQNELMEISTLRLRAGAMSERAWNHGSDTSYENFRGRLASTDAQLDRLLSPVTIRANGLDDPDHRIFMNNVLLRLELPEPYRADNSLEIHYEICDQSRGSDLCDTKVTQNSPLYTGGIMLSDDAYVMAAAFTPTGSQVGPAVREWYRREFAARPNLALHRPVFASGGSNPEGAVDGALSICTNRWQIESSGGTLTVDLESTQTVYHVALLFGPTDTFPSDYYPPNFGHAYQYRVDVSTSINGTWSTVVDRWDNSTESTIRGEEHIFTPIPTRYVRVELRSASGPQKLALNELQVFEEQTQ